LGCLSSCTEGPRGRPGAAAAEGRARGSNRHGGAPAAVAPRRGGGSTAGVVGWHGGTGVTAESRPIRRVCGLSRAALDGNVSRGAGGCAYSVAQSTPPSFSESTHVSFRHVVRCVGRQSGCALREALWPRAAVRCQRFDLIVFVSAWWYGYMVRIVCPCLVGNACSVLASCFH
jgi:hypothetical protein